MTIRVQTQLAGDLVKAKGVVDFLITDSRKAVCVVETKDWGKDTVQSILGMEVAVEQNDREVMYGIVSDFDGWHFLKRTDDGVERFVDAVNLNLDLREELKRVSRRVYAILCSQD